MDNNNESTKPKRNRAKKNQPAKSVSENDNDSFFEYSQQQQVDLLLCRIHRLFTYRMRIYIYSKTSLCEHPSLVITPLI